VRETLAIISESKDKKSLYRLEFSSEEAAGIMAALEVLKPEGKVTTRRLRNGELDFDAWVKYRDAKKTGMNPEERYYKKVEYKSRAVAQLILWDVSGSTREYFSKASLEENMRIIDAQKYGILHYVVGAAELGDDIAIIAYNSRGRDDVCIYPLMMFNSEYGPVDVVRRIMGVAPSDNNHDGAALRHVLHQFLLPHPARTKILVHINDGIPEDSVRYGKRFRGYDLQDYVGEYAIADVRKALSEYHENGIITFGLSYAKESKRALLEKIWGDDYKMIRSPYTLGRKIAQIMVEKTLA
jgi:nitric oxide reductase activation protein